jgi:hypothetical protein
VRFKHTLETDKRIRDGYAVNERVLDIATALGVTRNVIIGRAYRLGLGDPERRAANNKVFGRRAFTQEEKDRHGAFMREWWDKNPTQKIIHSWRMRLTNPGQYRGQR